MNASEIVDATTGAAELPPQGVTEELKHTAVAAAKTLQVAADDRGRLIGKTMDEHMRLANMYMRDKILPSAFDSLAKVMAGMQFAYALGYEPVVAMRQMYFCNGVLTAFGDLPLGVVEKSGLLAEHEEFLVDREYNRICFENKNLTAEPWAGVCRTKRKGRATWMETYFTIDQARTAGLLKNTWTKYPGDMLTYRARSRNLKSNFPDALGGLAIAEFDFNEMPEARDVSEPKEESRINKMYKEKENVAVSER